MSARNKFDDDCCWYRATVAPSPKTSNGGAHAKSHWVSTTSKDAWPILYIRSAYLLVVLYGDSDPVTQFNFFFE